MTALPVPITDVPRHIVAAPNLAEHIDKAPGPVHLIRGQAVASRIIGDVEPSSVMPGCLYVETEHGNVFLSADEFVVVAS